MKRILLFILLFIAAIPTHSYVIHHATGAQVSAIEDNCMWTVNSGMTSRSFSLWGNVKIVSDPASADICVFVVDKNEFADLVVSYTNDPNDCGQWNIVKSGEDFTVCFLDKIDFADITICFGDTKENDYLFSH